MDHRPTLNAFTWLSSMSMLATAGGRDHGHTANLCIVHTEVQNLPLVVLGLSWVRKGIRSTNDRAIDIGDLQPMSRRPEQILVWQASAS